MSQPKLNKHRGIAGRAHRFLLPRIAFLRLTFLGACLLPHAALAQAAQTYRVSPGPLGAALSEFAATAGVSLSSDSTLTQGLSSTGLSGQYSVEGGFSKLLAGSGLEAVQQSNGTYILRRPPAAASVLPEVRVIGDRVAESAWGPVRGYVASRSATGTKTDASILETPQSVSVVTADELQVRGVSNIKEAVGYTAGVTPSVSFDLREDLTTFRGFPFDWASFYLDGLAMPSTTYAVSTSEPYGMERIEVLRGPASMLYGQSSSGGILNMVSKRPSDVAVREIQLQAGSHNRRQFAFDLGGAQSADSDWNYRVVGLVRRSDTEIDFVEDNRVYVAPSLSWKPSAATSLVLLANYMYDDLGRSGGTSAFLPASGILLPNPNGKIGRHTYGGEPGFDFYEKRQVSLGYEFRHAFDDTWQFTQNARWRTVNVDYRTAYGLGLSPADPSQRTLLRAAFGSFGETRALSVDNQLQAKWESGGVRHTTLFGIDYRDFSVDEVRYFGPGAPSIDIFNPVYGADFALPATPDTSQSVKVRQVGFYVQDQALFARHWLLTLGARNDAARHDVDDRLGAFDNRRTERKTTGRAGLTYLFDNGLAPYVSVASSFTPVLTPNYYGEPFKALVGKQYEAGLKYQPAGGRSLYTAAVFELTQRNALTADPDQASRPFGQVQTGEYRSRGIELEAKAQLTRSLNLLAAYTHLDAEITKSNDGNVGGTPKGIPRNTASVWADYTFRGALHGLGLGLGARYVGKRPSDDSAAAYMVPAFTVLDAALSYELGDWRLALNASNLADKTIYDCWYARCWYGAGRSLRATLTLRW